MQPEVPILEPPADGLGVPAGQDGQREHERHPAAVRPRQLERPQQELSRHVRKTWWICGRRLLGKLCTSPRYMKALFDRHNGNRVFAITLFRIAQWLAPIVIGWVVLLVLRRGHWGELLGHEHATAPAA